MRKKTWIATLGLVALAAAVILSGCQSGSSISEEQAEEAFVVGFGLVVVGTMSAQVGQTLPGMSFDQDEAAIIYEEFDVSELGTDYELVSGRIGLEAERVTANLELTGGPVQTLEFSVGPDQLSSDGAISATITANGEEIDIAFEPASATEPPSPAE